MFFSRRHCEIIDGLEIRGTAAFRARTRESLALLRNTADFELIRAHLGAIRQGRCSGMKAWADKPTFIVGKATWQHSALWYAGAIAHDAFHAKLYFDVKKSRAGKEPDAETWTGPASEKYCLSFQRRILARLGADEKLLDYIDECAENPTYQGHHKGWRSWLDYLKRRW